MSVSTTVPVGSFGAAFGNIDYANPDYEALRSRSDNIVPFGKHVGTTITELNSDHAIVEIGGEASGLNHMGTVHAGAIYTAADIAGAAAFVGAAAKKLYTIERLVLKSATASYRKPAVGILRTIATVDERELRAITSASATGRHDISGKAVVLNEADVTVAKFTFEYVCDVVHGEEA
jgi:acyl-coenzyme A thioesterase PaaI-like protein